ncbi:hypothetical protein R1sor_004342 [Riccia sorocarpa]|uniref:TrmE-type G domain-containing protein n=1 Tax=Riccia sorocarpa TaxID=122646 RepID=A0ABD3HIF5_9MARC
MARVLRHLAPTLQSRVWKEIWQPPLLLAGRRLAICSFRASSLSSSHSESNSSNSLRNSARISILHRDARIVESDKTDGDSGSKYTYEDTIAAIVTSLGGEDGSVAIVRLSGSSAVSIAGQLFRPARKSRDGTPWEPKSHRVEYGTVVDSSGAIIDEVLVVPMLAPRSYTREDVVELQCHGGSICVHRVLQLCLQSGARLAKPGEFSLRAFLNGRLDLSQAENVAELISAKTSVAAEAALAGLQGGLSSLVHDLRAECLELLGDIEARLDFEDEMPVLEQSDVISRVDSMLDRLQGALGTARRGELLQAGLQVAIVGRPNVGKSSLLNAWSQSSKAIVTDIPGTTRDVVEADVVVGGIRVNLLDTAGIRDTDDIVESIGVQRSKAAAVGADVVLMVVSASDGWTGEDNKIFQEMWGDHAYTEAGDRASRNGSHDFSKFGGAPSVLVINKVDTASPTSVILPDYVSKAFSAIVPTCAPQSMGINNLEAALLKLVGIGEVTSGGRQWAANQCRGRPSSFYVPVRLWRG